MGELWKEFYRKKRVLVTGGTGSIGREIVKQLLQLGVEVVRILSRNEYFQYRLQEELPAERTRFLLGDVRDSRRLAKAMEGVDIVFHAAALKHVPLCEYNPFEAVKTNVLGTQNVIDAAMSKNVEKVINVSTDKAVAPLNTMGATKLLAEKLIVAANFYKGNRRISFSSVRFGNVLGSRGSVLELFIRKAKEGEELPLTDPDMTRFVMTIPQAVYLVLKAGAVARGEEVFILKMPVVRMGTFAEAFCSVAERLFGCKPKGIKVIGKRPGEKTHEELMTEEESHYAEEEEDMYILYPPGRFQRERPLGNYSSDKVKPLNKEETEDFLEEVIKSG